MPTTDEGYVKFKAVWELAPAWAAPILTDLIHWRHAMHQHQLIGVYGNGIGYGNISQRFSQNEFIISGTATGQYPTLSPDHFTLVKAFDIAKNTVICQGPIMASSEAMSHAVIYRECPEIQGVIHIHHEGLWSYLLGKVPTTAEGATYGSPEMAYSIVELLRKTDLRKMGIFAMRSHPEGVFSFGKNLEAAAQLIFAWLEKFETT